MIRIIDGKGSGKTFKLLSAASKTGGTIVCSNPQAMKVKAEAYNLNMKACSFMSYEQYAYSPNGMAPTYIDELESYFKLTQDIHLGGYTLSTDDD